MDDLLKQEVRIIGGLYRGKKIIVPAVEGLRPTPDRVRETLFNWLMQDIRDAHCLDAFSGSGALGLEAFSRNAASVTLIEKAPEAFLNLQKLVNTFKTTQIELLKTCALTFLKNTKKQFDIVFLDPPYAKNLLPSCLETLAEKNCLVSGGLVYLEADKDLVFDAKHWECIKMKKAGQVVFGLLRKRAQIGNQIPNL